MRLLSYNIQVGISGIRPHHYITKSWKHFFPTNKRLQHLQKIAPILQPYDIVGLQELDAGSRRTAHINLTKYLAELAGFGFQHHQLNRNFGRFAQHGNGMLSHIKPHKISEYKLPGLIPGRGALAVEFGQGKRRLLVVLLHLALGRKTRMHQLAYTAELLRDHPYAVVMGDMNCEPHSAEMLMLLSAGQLQEPHSDVMTFPSWKPRRQIDHILVSSQLEVLSYQALNHLHSDHLPVAIEIALPPELHYLKYQPS